MATLRQALETFMNNNMFDKAYMFVSNIYKNEGKKAYGVVVKFRNNLKNKINDNPKEATKYLRKSYLLTAQEYFDDYAIILEWNKPIKDRFYLPRRKELMVVVNALQDLEDDKLDLLTVSMPPGVGKTTIAIYYLTWLSGKYPNQSILGGSHSNSFLEGVYRECLRLITSDEYNFKEVFPNVTFVSKNGDNLRIDLGEARRFETLEFSSIGSGNAGKVRCSKLLYCDDLVDGIETALSKTRLDKLWEQYTTDLRQRKIGNCKELHIATRWSVNDVIGRLEQAYKDDDKARFIKIPALNEKDESNFDYKLVDGFSTKFYITQREIMDDVSWKALYMNEPIEREGLLYEEKELRRFFDLPNQEPDSIIAVCDTKDKGTDYCVLPIAYRYGEDFYIDDILCDDSKPEIIDDRLVEMLLKHKVELCRFESNSAGGRVAQLVQERVKKENGLTKITTKYTTANKETKIIMSSTFVKDHFLFKDNSVASKEYKMALNFLCSYSMKARNKHDDVPDAMAMLVDFISGFGSNVVEIRQRFW